MNSQVVLDNEWVTVWDHPAVNVIHHKSHIIAFAAPLRDELSAGTAAMRRFGATKRISQSLAGAGIAAQSYAAVTWLGNL